MYVENLLLGRLNFIICLNFCQILLYFSHALLLFITFYLIFILFHYFSKYRHGGREGGSCSVAWWLGQQCKQLFCLTGLTVLHKCLWMAARILPPHWAIRVRMAQTGGSIKDSPVTSVRQDLCRFRTICAQALPSAAWLYLN